MNTPRKRNSNDAYRFWLLLFIIFVFYCSPTVQAKTAYEWVNEGYTYAVAGKYQDALDAYNKALSIDPDDANTWIGKGSVLYNLARYQESLDAYNKALSIDPNNADVWYRKGTALYMLGRRQESLDAYDKALSIDPNHAMALYEKKTLFHLTQTTLSQKPTLTSTPVSASTPDATQTFSSSSGTDLSDPSVLVFIVIIGVVVVGTGCIVFSRIKRSEREKTSSLTEHSLPQELIPESFPNAQYVYPTFETESRRKEDLFKPVKPTYISRDRKMHDLVFISSKSADYPYVLKLYEFLISHKKNVFFSLESLPMMGNADYREEIDTAIDQAKHMVVVGSSVEYILSPWVKDEWGAFIIEKRAGRKPEGNLVTVLVGPVTIDDLPIGLRMNEVIPFDPEKFSAILQFLN